MARGAHEVESRRGEDIIKGHAGSDSVLRTADRLLRPRGSIRSGGCLAFAIAWLMRCVNAACASLSRTPSPSPAWPLAPLREPYTCGALAVRPVRSFSAGNSCVNTVLIFVPLIPVA